MPVSVHSIRVFNGFSSSSAAGPSFHLSSSTGGKPSAGLSFGSWRPKISTHAKRGGSTNYAQRPTLRLPYAARRVPPSPPPSAARLSTIVYSTEDPFTDSDFDPIRTVMHYPSSRSLNNNPSSKSPSISVAARNDIPANASDKEARSRLVAGILLHRVHAVGKPMRRTPMIRQGPREYVKSGLSTAITLEC